MPTSYPREATSRRCAACKHLRRRCTEECTLSPYFPASGDPDSAEYKRFLWVHKIFGASNVARLLEEAPVHRRAEAASCIVLEAFFRLRNPVYGTAGIITCMLQEIEETQCELAKTQAQIALFRTQQQQQQQQQQPQQEAIDKSLDDCYYLSDM